jgi:antirestriction protein
VIDSITYDSLSTFLPGNTPRRSVMNERRSLWKDQNEWEPDPNQPALRSNSSDCSTSTSVARATHRKKKPHATRTCALRADPCTHSVLDQIISTAANTSASAVTDSNPTARAAIGETPNSWKEGYMQGPPAGAGPESTDIGNEEHEVLQRDPPRIYVASLSDYNDGVLHGVWLDTAQDLDELHTAVNKMLATSVSNPHAEEYAIHDYEGFGRYRVGEYDSLKWINQVAIGITEHGLAFAAWADQCDHNEDVLPLFNETYRGEWDNIEAYAEELLTDVGWVEAIDKAIPETMQPYVSIDFAGFARDCILSGDVTVVPSDEGGVWVFEGRV